MPTPLRHSTIALAALLAAVVTAFAAPAANAGPAALQQSTSNCWLDVINDWLDNNRVDRTYAIPCYSQATQHLASLSDVSGYSSAMDDIHRALLAALRQDRGNGQGGPPGAAPSASVNHASKTQTSAGPASSRDDPGSDVTATPDTPPRRGRGLSGLAAPTDATSIPLPLIILGVLAILLVLAGLTAWAARRFQTRRPAPAGPNPRRR